MGVEKKLITNLLYGNSVQSSHDGNLDGDTKRSVRAGAPLGVSRVAGLGGTVETGGFDLLGFDDCDGGFGGFGFSFVSVTFCLVSCTLGVLSVPATIVDSDIA